MLLTVAGCENPLSVIILDDVIIIVPTVTGPERKNDNTQNWDWDDVADGKR